MDTYVDCDVCGERFWDEFQRFLTTVELPHGECHEVCTSCMDKRSEGED